MKNEMIKQADKSIEATPPSILILGLGNSIASDDAIGLHIVDKLKSQIQDPRIEIKNTERGGLNFIDLLQGFDKVVIIDAIKTGKHPPGSIIQFTPEEYEGTPRGAFIHEVSFFQAVKLAKMLDIKMPDEIQIFSVEIIDNVNVSESINPQVLKAVDPVIQQVREFIGRLKA